MPPDTTRSQRIECHRYIILVRVGAKRMCARPVVKLLALTGAVSLVLYFAVQNRCLCPASHEAERANAVLTRPVVGSGSSTTSAKDSAVGLSVALLKGA
jgi:hypothetical protein